jgi:hypothetical protein
MMQHWPVKDFVKHLGPTGFHPGAFAGGQDNDCKRVFVVHKISV